MRKDLILVALMVAILALMIIPISQDLIDVLLAMNIALSIVLLMMAIYLKHSSDFSTFPSVILISTAFRLALSIGTTRLILSEADAGQIIEVFGDFVVAGNVAIGLVIFLIVTVVQFLVVTKGAERVAEVGARFALDALPGKQMSIDADIRAGVIDAEAGEVMRRRLDKDSQFFGAMDGAMKFVKGDAIAGLIIIAINLIAGVAVGVLTHGMTFNGAVAIYSLLTIGDGLVAQIPALLMSMCAGVIVTRVASPDNVDLGTDISRELLSDYRVTGVAALIVFLVGVIPGFPIYIFSGCALVLAFLSLAIKRKLLVVEEETKREEAEEAARQADATRTVEQATSGTEPVQVSRRIQVLFGTDLAEAINMDTLRNVSSENFQKLGEQYGISFPHMRISVDEAVNPTSFVIECDEVPIVMEDVPNNHLMVSCEPSILERVGCKTSEQQKVLWPTFTGYWVPKAFKAALHDMEVFPDNIEERISERLFRVYEANIGLLFSRAEFEEFVQEAEVANGEAVSGILTELPRAELFQVMQYLVQDGVPVRPMALFLDSLLYWVQTSEQKTPLIIAECMRSSMKRQLCHAICGQTGVLGLAMLEPELETLMRQRVAEARRAGATNGLDGLTLPSEVVEPLLQKLHNLQQGNRGANQSLVIVASADLRRRLRNFLANNGMNLPVLAPHEISSDVNALPIELIKLPTASKRRPEKTGNRERRTGRTRRTSTSDEAN